MTGNLPPVPITTVIYILCVQATVPNMQDEHLTFVSFGRWQETILMDSFDLDSDGKAK